MSDDPKSDLLKALDALVEKQTFSLDAVEAINDLRTKVHNTQIRLDGVVNDNHNLRIDKSRLEKNVDALEAERTSLQAKITAMDKTVEEGKLAIHAAQKEAARAEAYRESLRVVFAPNTVREQIYKSYPMVNAGGNSYTTQQNESSSIEKTEGNTP